MSEVPIVDRALQWESRGLPDFLVVGPPRTGTTWLHDVMQHHANLPRIVKEPRFFDLRYSKGLDWYRRHFEPLNPGLPLGEMGATYFYSVEARERISTVLPNVKIICTLRDPVERSYSLYRLRCASGNLRCSFLEALSRDHEMRESARYYFHLKGWIDLFGRNRILVLTYEQLVNDPQKYVDEICRFIGIVPFALAANANQRKGGKDNLRSATMGPLSSLAIKGAVALETNGFARSMSLIRKLRLRKLFLSDSIFRGPVLDPGLTRELRIRMLSEVEALEKLLQRDLSIWKPQGASN